jgi:hypothetical protein
VTVFQASKEHVEQMLYPTALLVTAMLMVIGLGVYQRLSAEVERQTDQADIAAQKAEASAAKKSGRG